MKKVIGMLVALAVFCAMPAVAFAGEDGVTDDGDQQVIGGDANAGGINDGGGGYDGDGYDGDNTVNTEDSTNCAISQAAGGDAHAENNCGNVTNVTGDEGDEGGVGGGEGGVGGGEGGVGGDEGGVGGGVGGGGVTSVGLARTGFDAWLLAVIGGLSLAGGLGLLAAQRRGRIGA